MKTIRLKRICSNSNGTFGVLTYLDTEERPYCVTLEPIVPLIPLGTYNCARYKSPKFGYDVFVIENVPNHSFIEIHIGNTIKDTHGCILLGQYAVQSGIANSTLTFDNFMREFSDDKIILEVLS